MNNVIKAGIYRILRSKAFIGCLIFCILDLIFAIIMNKVMYGDKLIYGANSLISSLTNNGTIGLVFIILMAMVISEDYSCGAIKNIVGKGVNKLNYYIGNIVAVMIISVAVMLGYTLVITIYYTVLNGFGSLEGINNIFAISFVQLIMLFAIMSMIATSIIITKKTMAGLIIGYIILYIPTILNIISMLIKLKFNFEIIGLNYYQSILTTQTFESKILVQAILVSVCYTVLAIVIANTVLKKQDIK